jgi:peptidoglycan pentaglycine glycine transferase (the first glycine)
VKIDPDVREDTTAGRLVLHALERRGWRFSAEQIQFKNTAFGLCVGRGRAPRRG